MILEPFPACSPGMPPYCVYVSCVPPLWPRNFEDSKKPHCPLTIASKKTAHHWELNPVPIKPEQNTLTTEVLS